MGGWETREEEMVQMHYYEDIANHIGPEPCSGIREDADRVGQPLSHENGLVLSADAVALAKGNMPACAKELLVNNLHFSCGRHSLAAWKQTH